jgi:hypothetical protein
MSTPCLGRFAVELGAIVCGDGAHGTLLTADLGLETIMEIGGDASHKSAAHHIASPSLHVSHDAGAGPPVTEHRVDFRVPDAQVVATPIERTHVCQSKLHTQTGRSCQSHSERSALLAVGAASHTPSHVPARERYCARNFRYADSASGPSVTIRNGSVFLTAGPPIPQLKIVTSAAP